MNEKDYIRHLLIDRLNKVSRENTKANEKWLKASEELQDTTGETRKLFLKSIIEENNEKMNDTQKELNLITEILKNYN